MKSTTRGKGSTTAAPRLPDPLLTPDGEADAEPSPVALEPAAGSQPAPADSPAPLPISGWGLDRLVERIHPHYAFLLALPLLIYMVNPNWIFQGLGHMDPWYYFGLSINFPRYQHLVIGYPSERLTWILPSRLFVMLFSPVYGWLLFHLFIYWLSTFTLYSLVRSFAGSRAALVSAVILASHPFFLGTNGWTYVESGSLAYFLLSLRMLAAARWSRNPALYVTLAGVFWAAAAYNYLLWWILTPSCALFYWAVADPQSLPMPTGRDAIRRYIAPAAYFMLGIGLTTLFMTGAFYLIYGYLDRFFYYDNLAAAKFNLTLKKGDAVWGEQSFGWVLRGGWIMFPVLAFVASAIAWIRALRGHALSRLYLGLTLAYTYSFGVLVILTIRENHVLQFDYYASILMPLEFIVLGVLVFPAPAGISRRLFYFAVAGAAAILVAPLWRTQSYTPGLEKNILWHYVLAMLVIGAVIVKKSAATWTAAVLGLAVACFGLVPRYPNNAWNWGYDGLAAMTRISRAVMTVDRNTPVEQYPVFWFDNYDYVNRFTAEYRAIMCALQSHGLSMQHYPEVDPNKKYDAGTIVILITKERDVFESANASMTHSGMPLRLLHQDLITGEDHAPRARGTYWLTTTQVLPVPVPAAAQAR